MKLPTLLALGVLALGPAAHAADLSGLWIVTSNLAQAPAPIDCTIMQIGVSLSGWCEPETANAVPAALSGTLSQSRASWSSRPFSRRMRSRSTRSKLACHSPCSDISRACNRDLSVGSLAGSSGIDSSSGAAPARNAEY